MVKDKLFRANGSGSSLELVPERQLTVCSNALVCFLLPLLYSFAGNANMLPFVFFFCGCEKALSYALWYMCK